MLDMERPTHGSHLTQMCLGVLYKVEHCRAKDKSVLKASHGACPLLLAIVVSLYRKYES